MPVRATVPKLKISIRDSLDFGMRPVRETAEQTLSIDNVGEVAAEFEWTVPQPFEFVPASGVVEPGKSLPIVAKFTPTVHPPNSRLLCCSRLRCAPLPLQDACSLDAKAVCVIQGRSFVVRIAAMAKHPHIAFERAQLDFGRVLMGKRVDKEVRVCTDD